MAKSTENTAGGDYYTDSLKIDLKNKETELWGDYGLVSAPINFLSKDGTTVQSLNKKAIIKDDRFVAIVPAKYHPLPNEVAVEMATEIGNELGFMPKYNTNTKTGNGVYAQFVSEKLSQEVVEGDVVQLGFQVRNSIDRTTPFGIDFFTLRLVCSNGAISRGNSIGSLNANYYGKERLEELKVEVRTFVKETRKPLEHIVASYKGWVKKELTLETAELLAKYIPTRMLPFIEKNDAGEISLRTTDLNLWEAFNEATAKIWHGKAQIQSKSRNLEMLHEILAKVK